ncbi:MAG: DMT family transporter [Qingshengfaniella sp.]
MRASDTHPELAALFVLIAMALMGLVDNLVPIIGETTGLWQFQILRSGLALILLCVIARWRGWRLAPKRYGAVLLRSFLVSSGLILYFAALALLPIAEAVAGLFTAPIFVLLLSVLFLGQRIGRVRVVAALAGFAGVLLVLRPDAGGLGLISILPVAAGVVYAMGQIITREYCGGESAQTLTFGFFAGMGVWGLIGLAVLSVFPQPVPDGAAGFPLRLWGQMSAAALGGTVAQAVASLGCVGLITRAYLMAEASFVSVFEYAMLISVVFWAWVLFGDQVDLWTGLGVAIIIVSGAVLALRGKPASPDRPTRLPV